jgi:sulfite dehydrogenase (cytochrome) subunit B
MRRWAAVALGVLGSGAVAAAEAQVALVPGEGQDAVRAHCAACHSVDYIVINSPFLTEGQWRAEVTKMRQAFGARIDDAAAAAIVGYLAAHYAVAEKP